MDKRSHESDLGPFSLPELKGDELTKKEQLGLEAQDVSKVSELAVGRAIERSFGTSGSGAPTTSQASPTQVANPIMADITFTGTRVPQAPPISASLSAEDKDRIEKEWVHIAKAIVDQTKDDPFKQKKEVNKISKDYVKKRFNLDLKIDDSE